MTPQEVLRIYKKIAVVGLSPNPDRPSHYVSEHMIENGYEVVGVNPGQTEILDRPVYPKLSDVPGPLEIVAVFRASEYLPEVVDDAIARKPKVLWIQLGIHDPEAEAKAEKNGIEVIRQRCLMVEHQGLRR
jgi:predicted CoA-binding protein